MQDTGKVETRVAPVTELTDEMRALVAPPPGYEKKAGDVPLLYAMLLHNPPLLRKFRALSSHFLLEGLLAPRDRELAVLRIAWLRQLAFIWGEHVQVGRRIGLARDEIERVTQGASASGWSRHDRAILRAAEELYERAVIGDETWAILAETLDESRLVELPVLIGQYQTLGFLQNSLRLPLWPGNDGLAAR
jgi:alkylhydroperoxidase family enzyme